MVEPTNAPSLSDLELDVAADVPPMRLLGCRGREEIGSLFRYEVFVHAERPFTEDDKRAILRRPCAIVFGRGPREFVCGVVASLRVIDTVDGPNHLRLEVVPSAALLDSGRATRAFVGESVDEIVGSVLGEYGMQLASHHQSHLTATYPKRSLVTQRDESDWAFCQRWLRHYGISTWFEHGPEGDVLHLGDEVDPRSRAHVTYTLPRLRRNNLELGHCGVAEIDEVVATHARTVCLHDVSLDLPAVGHRFEAKAELGFGAAHHRLVPLPASEAEGEMLAKRRAERLACEGRHYVAVCNHAAVRVGSIVRTDVAGEERAFWVTAVDLAVGHMTHEGRPERYLATLTLHDASTPYRPATAERTWPRVGGVELAFVEGDPHGDDQGTEAHPDDQGRYVVRLASASPGAAALTMPLRVAQLASGAGEATHFPLRPGTPVLLAYEHGDPDRPYVLAALGHAATMHAVATSSAYRAVLRSATGATIELADQAANHEEKQHEPAE